MRFTDEQERAIKARNRTLLVSAAAGSGKTAVLVERIYWILLDEVRLNRMLIVTFTRAAAAEMRSRLSARLRDGLDEWPELMTQALDDLETTQISTLHAFCQTVLREDFQALGIDPLARTCTEEERRALLEQAVVDALNLLLPEDEGVQRLLKCFRVDEVKEMVLDLYHFLMSLPKPFRWLREQAELAARRPLSEHPWYKASRMTLSQTGDSLRCDLDALERMLEDPEALPAYPRIVQADRETVRPLLAGLEHPEALPADALPWARLPNAKKTEAQDSWPERFAKLRGELKDRANALQEQALRLRDRQERMTLDLDQMAENLRALSRVTEVTHERFLAAKREDSLIDFTDMEQLTYDLLTDPEQPWYREKYQRMFDQIFVDECQDLSQIQNDILMAIHGPDNALFMVGDVKQSIYRFRQANPTLFLDRVLRYSRDPDAEERAITLQRNFRSTQTILRAANEVFRRAMRADTTELDYRPEDELIPGDGSLPGEPVEVRLTNSGTEAEIRDLCARIRQLTDPTHGGCAYRDIAVLLRELSTSGDEVLRIFEEEGIPVFCDAKSTFFSLNEIQDIHSLLRLMNDLRDDLARIAVLQQVPFRLNEDDLAEIRRARMGRDVSFTEAFEACCAQETPLAARCREIEEQLSAWRFVGTTLGLFDFVWYLLRETGLYAEAGTRTNPQVRQANLRIFAHKAAQAEHSGILTLSSFLNLLSQERESSDKTDATPLGEGEDLVRLMTIHKSKGLQFPVVFIALLDKKMDRAARGTVRMHRKLGVALPYRNPELSIVRNTLAQDVIAEARRQDERAESLRLLYVGMTRAREKLILCGQVPDKTRIWRTAPGAHRVREADSMLDWVMQAVCDLENDPETPFRLSVDEPLEVPPRLEAEPEAPSEKPAAGETLLPWWDEHPVPDDTPLKTSVTSLSRKHTLADPMPLTDEEEDMEVKRRAEVITLPLTLSSLPRQPAWMQEKTLTAAERGTAAHRVLSLVPLEPLRNADAPAALRLLEACMADWRTRLVFSEEEAEAVRLRACADFFLSPLGRRMLASPEIQREWRFNLRMPDSGVILQGVIDAAFRDGDGWVLIDYKTDRIENDDAFVQRHQEQMNWYALALGRILREPVRELWLWSIGKSRAYEVPLTPPPGSECFT
ncbi:MAG: UvrD-helicase domain-containing protein [Clostridia bacterium]|nr:UvrD-helicase domain-containing protein [Clostridia bacterium]